MSIYNLHRTIFICQFDDEAWIHWVEDTPVEKLKEEVLREAARLNGLSREDHLKEVKRRLMEVSKKIKQFEKEKKKLENEEQKLQEDVKRRGEVETLHKTLPQVDSDSCSKVVQLGQHLVTHQRDDDLLKKSSVF